jgi:ribonucleoside-diphosphate reductase alpha chain
VRLGTYTKADGTAVPMWHDSEVAAIAYAIQNIIARRNGEPVAALATPAAPVSDAPPTMIGAKCPECGAHAMIRKDGCDFCTQCGHVGACG